MVRVRPTLRRIEVRNIVLLAMFLGFTLSLPAQEPPSPAPAQPPAGLFTPLAGEFTPLAPADLASRPAPKLFDGTPDISGPWVGGGSNDDIEREGGLKPGECRCCRGQRPFEIRGRKKMSRICTAHL